MGRSARHGPAIAAALAAALIASAPTGAAQPDPAREYHVKAAFVFNVMKFVGWPDAALGSGTDSIVLAVLGGPATDHIEQALRNKRLNGRPVVVERHSRAGDLRKCHAVYVTSESGDVLADVLSAVGRRPVLTVSERANDSMAAMIALSIKGTKLSFDVNLDAAEGQGLGISANLLELAANVRSTRLGKGLP